MKNFLSIAVFVATSVMRIARIRWARNGLAVVGLMAALSSPALAAYVFGQGTIKVPATVAPGTIVARDYVTPQQICGSAQCSGPWGVQLWQYGGKKSVTGPDVLTSVLGLSTRMIINGQPVVTGILKTTITRPVEIQLVANGTAIQAGTLQGLIESGTSPAYFTFNLEQSGMYQFFLAATVQVISGTCTVPSQTVTLPAVSPTKFGGVGSVQGTQSFDISFTGCPPGYNRVGYSLVPAGSETTAAGALPLSADSTATGVRIRIANPNGSAVTFNTSIPLSTYNTNTGGSYSVPYQASYVQTGSSVTPGSVSGSMQVLLDYQ